MYKRLISRSLLSALLLILVQLSYADKHNEQSVVESLSPEVRALLSKEMLAIQEGMVAIIPAYSAGNSGEIASIARQIKESFVLKQNLSKAQKEELHNKLPVEFLELDRQFHYNAGMLQHAAENHKHELIGFYFSQMSEACADCHSQFATHKFPYLMPESEAVDNTHSH